MRTPLWVAALFITAPTHSLQLMKSPEVGIMLELDCFFGDYANNAVVKYQGYSSNLLAVPPETFRKVSHSGESGSAR